MKIVHGSTWFIGFIDAEKIYCISMQRLQAECVFADFRGNRCEGIKWCID
jgi:hypothetical protein